MKFYRSTMAAVFVVGLAIHGPATAAPASSPVMQESFSQAVPPDANSRLNLSEQKCGRGKVVAISNTDPGGDPLTWKIKIQPDDASASEKWWPSGIYLPSTTAAGQLAEMLAMDAQESGKEVVLMADYGGFCNTGFDAFQSMDPGANVPRIDNVVLPSSATHQPASPSKHVHSTIDIPSYDNGRSRVCATGKIVAMAVMTDILSNEDDPANAKWELWIVPNTGGDPELWKPRDSLLLNTAEGREMAGLTMLAAWQARKNVTLKDSQGSCDAFDRVNEGNGE